MDLYRAPGVLPGLCVVFVFMWSFHIAVDARRTSIKKLERLSPPLDLQMQTVNCTAIRVQWRMPRRHVSTASGYKVFYTEMRRGRPVSPTMTVDVPLNPEVLATGQFDGQASFDVMIGKLKVATQYRVSVGTYGWAGEGRPSTPRDVSTASHEICMPPSPPTQPLVVAVSDTELALSWQQWESEGTAPVLYFLVAYIRPEMDTEWTYIREPVESNSMVLKGLVPETEYQFVVRSVNVHGISPPSSINNPVRTLNTADMGSGDYDIYNTNSKDKYDFGVDDADYDIIIKELKPFPAVNTNSRRSQLRAYIGTPVNRTVMYRMLASRNTPDPKNIPTIQNSHFTSVVTIWTTPAPRMVTTVTTSTAITAVSTASSSPNTTMITTSTPRTSPIPTTSTTTTAATSCIPTRSVPPITPATPSSSVTIWKGAEPRVFDTSCDETVCPHDSFCLDNYRGGSRCHCNLGRQGDLCSEVVAVRFPRFYGYSQMTFEPLKHSYQRFHITVEFKADSKDGLLLYCGEHEHGHGDFTSLALIGGKLHYRFNCGTGAAHIVSQSSVVIGQWHIVSLFREGLNGWLQLDNDTPVSGRSQVPNTRTDTQSRVPNTCTDMQSRVPNTRTDTQSRVPNAHTDTQSRVPNARTDTQSRVPNARTDTQSRVPNARTDTQSRVPNARTDTQSRVPNARTDTQSRVPNARTDTQSRVPNACTDTQSRVPNARTDTQSRVPNARTDTQSRVPNARTDTQSRVPNARTDTQSRVPNARTDTQSRVPNARTDTQSRVPNARTDTQSRVPNARTDTLSRVPNARTDTQSRGQYTKITFRTPLYVGGAPTADRLVRTVGINHGFRGCVQSLLINSKSTDLRPWPHGNALSGADIGECNNSVCDEVNCVNGGVCFPTRADSCICLCPLGFRGDHCEEGFVLSLPQFNASLYSYISAPWPQSCLSCLSFMEFDITFQPASPDGALLYSDDAASADFLSVRLVGGYVELRFDCGSGVAVIRSEKAISMNTWHELHVSRTAKNGILQVDNQPPVEGNAEGAFTQIRCSSPLYIGGVPDYDITKSNAGILRAFSGAIQKITLNDHAVAMTTGQALGVNVENALHPCVENPCVNGGTCHPQRASYDCDCVLGYDGKHCQKECGNYCLNTVTEAIEIPQFTGRSYLTYDNPHILRRVSGSRTNLFMRFKSTSKDGMLLWRGEIPLRVNSDYLALGLQNGSLIFSYNLGSGSAVVEFNGTFSDGKWHRVKAVREGQFGKLTVDDYGSKTGRSAGKMRQLNISGVLYVGGMKEIALHTSRQYLGGLVGCISHFTLSTDYHVALVEDASDGKNINTCTN
ncbi:hypothetical protein P4O66_005451 [Electrophorus voltai]|uniref:EGF like, fibronectin type III and laminin G domains n=1 Tax=Electrophorus voltai TaxID=2609070 RepID=A0AAD8ZYH7_9TELE|nr:hypothetical protein P4O66_005451 [Electrophorus voltai]